MKDNPQIIIERPPIWKRAQDQFGFEDKALVLFAWDTVIFNPNNAPMPQNVIDHESTHLRQQNGQAEIWWNRYLKDPAFRLEQEIEAYKTQYQSFCTRIKDKNSRFRCLHDMASILSGPLYGYLLDYNMAKKKISTL